MTTAAQAVSAEALQAPSDWLAFGLEQYRARDVAGALTAFQSGLAAAEALGDTAVTSNVTHLHFRLANAASDLGDLATAELHYKLALRIDQGLVHCWWNLGNLFQRRNRPNDAIPYYVQALDIDASHLATRLNLTNALVTMQQWVIVKPILDDLIKDVPDNAQAWNLLGKYLHATGLATAALKAFETAVSLAPNDADSLYWVASLRQTTGDTEAARASYLDALKLQPLIRRSGAKFPPDFTVLALYAPFGGNTPTEYLFDSTPYDTNTYTVLPGQTHDLALLRSSGDIVVNLISDADQAVDVLPDAVQLADQLGGTIINHPREILATTREKVAERLGGLPNVRVPRSVRVPAHAPSRPEDLVDYLPSSFPILARPAGTHGGDDFEVIADLASLSAFIGEHPGADHYLIDYIDYQSSDGYFRKYRFIFVDGGIWPYHLAIGNTWKVHHVNTDMIHHQWMQDEEKAFLANPQSVFSPANYDGLRAIADSYDLQYFGIDCGLDREGRLVVFEVNASMLVHKKNEDMPYKDPYVADIKAAWDRVVTRVASKST